MKHQLLINLLREDAKQMKASGDFGWQRTAELAAEALEKIDNPESPINQQEFIARIAAAKANNNLSKQLMNVDWLSNVIRTVDGNHCLGAGALAEAIIFELNKTSCDHLWHAAEEAMCNALAEQAETHAIELRERDERIRQLEQEQVPVSDLLKDGYIRVGGERK